MTKSRVEAFSDGVMAIALTIMVMELKAPDKGAHLSDLIPLIPTILSYMLSFIYVGIYWNNHHHMFQMVHKINGRVLWRNLNLLFWLSLIPFTTAWINKQYDQPVPIALYGFVMLMAAIAYLLLQKELIRVNGRDSKLALAIGDDAKGKISGLLYVLGIGGSFIMPWIGIAAYTIVAVIWFIPDKRIEKIMNGEQEL